MGDGEHRCEAQTDFSLSMADIFDVRSLSLILMSNSSGSDSSRESKRNRGCIWCEPSSVIRISDGIFGGSREDPCVPIKPHVDVSLLHSSTVLKAARPKVDGPKCRWLTTRRSSTTRVGCSSISTAIRHWRQRPHRLRISLLTKSRRTSISKHTSRRLGSSWRRMPIKGQLSFELVSSPHLSNAFPRYTRPLSKLKPLDPVHLMSSNKAHQKQRHLSTSRNSTQIRTTASLM